MDRPLDRLSDADLFTSPMTFMGAPYGRPGPNNKAAILGIPFDCGTNMRIGARGGPDSVRQQSVLMRRFNPTNADFDPVAAGQRYGLSPTHARAAPQISGPAHPLRCSAPSGRCRTWRPPRCRCTGSCPAATDQHRRNKR
mgnify:CR=1 FL=1